MRELYIIWLAVYTFLWSPVDGKNWLCGVDICTEGVHFCHADRRICFKCEDFETTCFSRLHESNCSSWCEANFKKKVEQTIIETTCGPLPLLQNGYANGTNSTLHRHDDVVYFKCDPGFDRVGPESITCIGNSQWSSFPPICQRGDADIKDTYSPKLLVLSIVGYVLFIVVSIYSVYLYRKNKKQEKLLEPSAAEAAPLFSAMEAGSIDKTEPFSIKVVDPSLQPESTERDDATRNREMPSTPPRPPTIPSAPPANTDGSETPETNPKVPIGSESEGSHRSTRAIQETGIKEDHSTERPLPPRETEALQPVDDDSGEKGLSPDLPSAAAGIS